MEMSGNFCQILELGGTTIKGWRLCGKWYHRIAGVDIKLNIL